jgi:DedD protein
VFGSFHTVSAILRQPKNQNDDMAERKEADDSFNPRHRIVGAVVLVALAVIFLPMLLNDRAPEKDSSTAAPDTRSVVLPVTPPRENPVGNIMPPESEKITEKPGTAKTVIVPVEPTTEIPAAVKAPVTPELRQPEAKPVPETKPVAATKKSTEAVKPATTAGKHWVVQVGAFSQLENAKRLHERLAKKGYSAILDPPNPANGKTVRVEVGPYRDAAAAKAAQARIQSEFGIKGVVRKQ